MGDTLISALSESTTLVLTGHRSFVNTKTLADNHTLIVTFLKGFHKAFFLSIWHGVYGSS